MIIMGILNNRKQNQIFLIKKLDDGSTLVASEVRTGSREIAFSSLRRYPERTNAETIVKALTHNVRNALSSVG